MLQLLDQPGPAVQDQACTPPQTSQPGSGRLRALRIGGSLVFSAYQALLYFFSFLVPVVVVSHYRALPTYMLLAMAIVGYGMAGASFLLLLVLTKRFIIGPIRATGRVTIHDPGVQRWFSAAMLTHILDSSPFRSMTLGLSLVAPWYYRGMGAKMPESVLIGCRALIFEPWFLEVGENVNIGADAMILGHLGEGKEIVLGRVVIGDGAIVGLRAIIFPDVHIGKNARVAAGALVLRGTNIPDGETWAGVPARKISKD